MIRALCDEYFTIQNISEANDTQLLFRLLMQTNQSNTPQRMDCEDAGTPYRFLLSYLAMKEGNEFILTGTERLKERPISQLVNALRTIGADILYLEKEGYAPLRIIGKKLHGGQIEIDSNVSSQFISSLCLIAPCLQEGLIITLNNPSVSTSYITMTLEIMKEFGVNAECMSDQISIPHQTYKPKSFYVENDWSSATFFYAMAMLSPQIVLEMDGLYESSSQGDAVIKSIAEDFGISSIFNGTKLILRRVAVSNVKIEKEYNLNSCPDLAIPFIVLCAVKFPKVKISGIQHLELKESKRITALSNELIKIGIQLHYNNDVMSFEKKETFQKRGLIKFETYNDHRIAMALSMLCLCGYTVELDQTDCVRKSFPGFFDEIAKLGIKKS